MEGQRFPRDKDQLLKEVDLRMRLGDISRMHELQERLAPRWWEPMLVVVLFVSALGLLASLTYFTKVQDDPVNKWILFWIGLMVLTMVMSFQVILMRIYNFRRANDLLARMAEEHGKRLAALEERLARDARPAAPPADEPAA